jgi:hypothetical protein
VENRLAAAAPMPWLAPVTISTFSARSLTAFPVRRPEIELLLSDWDMACVSFYIEELRTARIFARLTPEIRVTAASPYYVLRR